MGSRCGLVAIGLWTMFQSIAYGALAVAAALAHRCSIDMARSQFAHLLYAFYLRDDACGPIDWDLLAGQTSPAADQRPIMPPISRIAERTDVLAIVYFALNCAWLLVSLGLLFAVSACCAPKRALVYMWLAVTALVSVLDLTASGLFIYDLVQSLTVDAFLRHFDITLPASEAFAVPKYLLVVPSAVMLAVSARFIVFWIVNVVLLFLVVPIARRSIFKDIDDDDQRSEDGRRFDEDDRDEPMGMHGVVHYSRNNNNLGKMPMADRLPPSRYEDQAPRAVLMYGGQPTPFVDPQSIQRPPHEPHMLEHRYVEPLNDEAPVRSASPPGKIPSLQYALLDQQRITIDRPHLRTSRGASSSGGDSSSLRSSAQQPGHQQPYNRASTASPEPDANAANVPPPDELRGQLPWSYFKSPADITGPKRTFTQLRDDEDLPPVPVPDYTLHFPRKDRPSTNSSDEGAWTGPEHRY